MITDLAGIDSIKAAISNAPNFCWRITENKPNITEAGRITTPGIFEADADNNAEAAKRFEEWANLVLSGNPNNTKVYYLVIYAGGHNKPGRPKTPPEPIYFSFTLNTPYHTQAANSFPAGGHTGARMGSPATEKDYETMLELQRLKWENEQLRASIIDPITTDEDEGEEWEEEEEEEEQEQPIKVFTDFFSGVVNSPPEVQSPMQQTVSRLISGLADKLTGEPPEIKALRDIKAAVPDADKLLIKLGELSKTQPEAIREFVQSMLNTFNTPNNDK